jgi:hypothetical protein
VIPLVENPFSKKTEGNLMVPFRKYASDEIASSFAPRILFVEFTLFEKEGRGEISPNSRREIPPFPPFGKGECRWCYSEKFLTALSWSFFYLAALLLTIDDSETKNRTIT